MTVPLFGGLISDQPLTLWQIVCLSLIGFSSHLFGFVLNNLIDSKLDKHVAYRKNSPLLSGKITYRAAFILAILQVPLMYLIYIYAFNSHLNGVIILTVNILLSLIYNRFSKYSAFPKILVELSLALAIALMIPVGFYAVDTAINIKVYLFAGCYFLILHLLNSIPSGLKDLKTDYENHVESFVISWKCRMIDENKIQISKRVVVYSFFLLFLLFILFLTTAYAFQSHWFVFVLMSVFCFLSYAHLKELLNKTDFYDLRKFAPLLNGFYTYLASYFLLFDKLPLIIYIIHIYFFLIPFNNQTIHNKFNLNSIKNAWKF
jgi:4-hydroxybenzoate polyprenyltransferase